MPTIPGSPGLLRTAAQDLLRRSEVLAIALVDVESGLTLDAVTAERARLDAEAVAAAQAETLRGAGELARVLRGVPTEVVVRQGESVLHLLRPIPDPTSPGPGLLLSVLVAGPERNLRRVRRVVDRLDVGALVPPRPPVAAGSSPLLATPEPARIVPLPTPRSPMITATPPAPPAPAAIPSAPPSPSSTSSAAPSAPPSTSPAPPTRSPTSDSAPTAALIAVSGVSAVERTEPVMIGVGRVPARPEPSGVEPSGAEPSGAERSGAEPSGLEPSGAEPSGAEPSGAEPPAPGSGSAVDWFEPVVPGSPPPPRRVVEPPVQPPRLVARRRS